MNMSVSIALLFVLLLLGAFFSAWAGIRSLQAARTVVFYRTRRARMLAGWQWLALALVLALLSGAAVFLGEPVAGQFLSPTVPPTAAFTQTPNGTLTPSPTASQVNTPTQMASSTASSTPGPSATASLTPSRTPTIDGSALTTSAIQTERRSTFIAFLSSTPTATRTPIPTWTKTPTNPPPPTWTPSLTRTPRPTLTPSLTLTPTFTRTPSRTPTSTRTLTPARTLTPTP